VKKLKRIKDRIITVWIVLQMSAFGVWVIGGNLYNFLAKDQIQYNINQLEMVLHSITPLQGYTVDDVSLVPRNALIAKAVCTNIIPKYADNTPEKTEQDFKSYFLNQGWKIIDERHKPSVHIQFTDKTYIVTLDLTSPKENKWRIIVAHNTFFERYSL